jgi:hypothetical protein
MKSPLLAEVAPNVSPGWDDRPLTLWGAWGARYFAKGKASCLSHLGDAEVTFMAITCYNYGLKKFYIP